MRTKLKFIKRTLYKLKRSYGLSIDYYNLVTHSLNTESGIKETTLSKISIDRAVVLRAREFRSFVYDLAFISANKDFTTGGFFDPEDRKVIIDASDVPDTFEPNIDDYFIFQNEKYEVKEIFHLENNYGYLLLGRKLRGSIIVRIEDIVSVLDLNHDATNVVEDKLVRSVESVLTLTQTFVEVP